MFEDNSGLYEGGEGMTHPRAHLGVFDGRMGIACPYCGIRIPKDGVRFRPAFDPGDGIPDPRHVSWESRCPRCGGRFSIPDATAPRHSQASTDVHARRDRDLLLGVMASLDSLELAVAEFRTNQSSPSYPRDPPWFGREGA